MKYAILACRILLGLAFLVFGANILFPFLHMPTPPPSDAATWSEIMKLHKWMAFIGLCQVIGGLLVLVGRFVPLGLTILAPVLVNILLFHITLAGGQGIVTGLVLTLLEAFLLVVYRRNFYSLFEASPEPLTAPLTR